MNKKGGDIKMQREDVYEIVHRVVEQLLVTKHCSVCKTAVLMIKFSYEYRDSEDLWTMGEQYRCMGCLNLFKEELTVIEHPIKG